MLSTSMEIRSTRNEVVDLEAIFQQYNRMVYRTALRVLTAAKEQGVFGDRPAPPDATLN